MRLRPAQSSCVPPPTARRVLLIKPSALGDVVGALPVLHALRRRLPRAHLAWLVTPPFGDILAGETELDEVIPFQRRHFGQIGRRLGPAGDFWAFCRDLRRRKFDWVIDLQGLLRSGLLAWVTGAPVRAGFADCRERAARVFYTHAVRAGDGHAVDRNIAVAAALGVDAGPEDFRLSVPERARQSAQSLLAGHGLPARGFAVISPGTSPNWNNKAYPPRLWRRVLTELARQGPLVLVGSPSERELCAELAQAAAPSAVNLAGQTTLAELAAVIAAAGVVVCSDTAANFIGPAVGTPSVALLGPTRASYIGPYRGAGTSLTAEVACLGCRKRSCRHVTCMQMLEPSRVVQAVRDILRRPDP